MNTPREYIPKASVVVNWPGSTNSFESVRIEGDGPFWPPIELTMQQAFAVAELIERVRAVDAGKACHL